MTMSLSNDRREPDLHTPGDRGGPIEDLVVKRIPGHDVYEIVNAPPHIEVSLELILQVNPSVKPCPVKVVRSGGWSDQTGFDFGFPETVRYWIERFDVERAVFVCRKAES